MYVKIKTQTELMPMPDLYKASWDLRNDDESRDFCASHDNWLIKQEVAPPEYDPETQFVTDYWEEEDGYAVQKWKIHEKPEPEPTIEDRVDNLEQNVSDIINGVTE